MSHTQFLSQRRLRLSRTELADTASTRGLVDNNVRESAINTLGDSDLRRNTVCNCECLETTIANTVLNVYPWFLTFEMPTSFFTVREYFQKNTNEDERR